MWTDPREETAAAAVAQRESPVGDSLDAEVVASLLELGDVDFFTELVDDFVASTRIYLDDLRSAVAAGDAEAAYKAAHTMKSSAANMGATRFSELCRGFEAAGRAGDLDSLEGAADQLTREFDLVRSDLDAAAERTAD